MADMEWGLLSTCPEFMEEDGVEKGISYPGLLIPYPPGWPMMSQTFSIGPFSVESVPAHFPLLKASPNCSGLHGA